jgi:hypothetical protein
MISVRLGDHFDAFWIGMNFTGLPIDWNESIWFTKCNRFSNYQFLKLKFTSNFKINNNMLLESDNTYYVENSKLAIKSFNFFKQYLYA